ncbi:MAG: glycoside hydrolase family 31 protein [Bacteroidia bacterium]|nr:glycoside hydrolase family 31 protein [Bacteroidia bacterium]
MEISRRNLQKGKGSPQLIERWEQKSHQFYFYCNELVLELSIYQSNIIRFRFSPEGSFEDDFSYSIAHDGPIPSPEIIFSGKEVGDNFEIHTPELKICISRTLHIQIYDSEGTLINEDERGFHWNPSQEFGGNKIHCSKRIQNEESFFGLGDKPNRLNLTGLRFETWGTDAYGFEKTSDPLYKNIPFYLGLHHEKAYGIFFDNTFRTFFDFGYERRDVCSFGAPGGEMNYYFIYGPSLIRVTEGYAFLTGTPELPPLWALGYHQSKWSYAPEANVKDLVKKMRDEEIPCDAIHLDIEYMDGFRCFTWDKQKFPNPKKLLAELEADGIKTVLIIDPGLKIDPAYQIYKDGKEKDVFCRRGDGPRLKGEVWPGDCHFPDFTDPKVRDWWASLFEPFIQKSGAKGIWNDMNEPAVLEVGTFPMDTRHDFDGHPCSHRKAHNVYGMQMARASFHGAKKAMFPKRPFLMTRSGYSGIQRYAATWTGDNLSTWEHLWMANIQCQRLSVSGVSFCGSDVGGFIGKCNGELLTRWMQLGIFHPLLRGHSSGDHGDQEPWEFGEPYTSAIRSTIQLRYKFLPYLYTLMWQNHNQGTPVIIPISFLGQDDPETYFRMEEFGFGQNIIVCPVSTPGVEGRKMYLPEGKWYNYWTNELKDGKQEFWVDAPLDQVPIFIRAGSLIPQYPPMNYVGEREVEFVELHLYHDTESYTSQLYEDAGDFDDHKQGNFMLRSFSQTQYEGGIRIRQYMKGRFYDAYNTFHIYLHGLKFTPKQIRVDDELVPNPLKENGKGVYLEVDKNFEVIVIN